MTLKLLVGLRNPGPSYEKTRHNAGEWFIKALLAQETPTPSLKLEKKCQIQMADLACDDLRFKVALPLSFMNLNGLPVKMLAQFYDIHPSDILIIHDDLDLAAGSIRLKSGGGHGGHRGLQDLIRHLGSADFHRLRIGIGHPGHKSQVADYVLQTPGKAEKKMIDEAIFSALLFLPAILKKDFAAVMNQLHAS